MDGKTPVCVGRFWGFAARYLAALFDDGSEAWYQLPSRGQLPVFPVGEVATARPDGPLLCTSVWRRRNRTLKHAAAVNAFAGIPELETDNGREQMGKKKGRRAATARRAGPAET
jgi:hypothetical protein